MTRVLLRVLAAVVLLAAAVLVGWRVLRPTELLASASEPWPARIPVRFGVTGHTNMAPLIVDDRLRVYASKHQVRADGPAWAETLYTATWSLRRWPEQVSGVVASGTTVITRWSDGELVAIDARTGKISWRADGPKAPAYSGHRTGAEAVWSPPGLRLTTDTVLVLSNQTLSAYAVSTGAKQWQKPVNCSDGFTTAGGTFVCSSSTAASTGATAVDSSDAEADTPDAGAGTDDAAVGVYDVATGAAVTSWPAGPFTAVGCEVASSGCAGFRDSAGQGWLTTSAAPARSTPLDAAGATVAAGVIISAGDGVLTARNATGVNWTWTGTAQVLGGGSGKIVLCTPDRQLIALDASTGRVVYDYPLTWLSEKRDWKPGGIQVTPHFVAIERLNGKAPDDPTSPIYYFNLDTVLIAAF
ncbi:PQQ-binding-like beta-propeller repeat protein [Actinoplanes sp. NPDC051851]|uniref:outer membrane protein assembly factor BamB family protein n=1 Tax=Actinoplanes sp. NPDC051851 TaxID=3154753 RepID=UPI00341761C7